MAGGHLEHREHLEARAVVPEVAVAPDHLEELVQRGRVLADHEGNGPILVQQWDGKAWNVVSDWISPMQDVVRPMIEASAAKFATENKIEPRKDCK